MIPNPLNFSDRSVEVLNRIIPRYSITEENSDTPIAQSMLGTPVYSTLEFMKVSGTSKVNPNDVMIRIDTALITVSQTKNIIITAIQGQQTSEQTDTSKKRIFSTVKEYISGGDYMITIRGAIMSEYPNVYPREDVELLVELLSLPKQLPIASGFLDLFSISNIVVENFSVSEKVGSRNEVPFEINCLSDEDIEFKLNA